MDFPLLSIYCSLSSVLCDLTITYSLHHKPPLLSVFLVTFCLVNRNKSNTFTFLTLCKIIKTKLCNSVSNRNKAGATKANV